MSTTLSTSTNTQIAFGFRNRPLLVHHVANRLGLSCRQVRYLAQRGHLPGFKIGKKIWGFQRAEVDTYSATRKAQHADY
jgi:excisionase family DNA binding protein